MSTLAIKKLHSNPTTVASLSSLLHQISDRYMIQYHNWEEFHNSPLPTLCSFNIGYTDRELCIQFYITESDILMDKKEDCSPVYEDSCAELFISFDNRRTYFNIEGNPRGVLLAGTGTSRDDRYFFTKEELTIIKRHTNITDLPNQTDYKNWELCLSIPWDFLKIDYKELNTLECFGNFYKCADNHEYPHYLSWNPIQTEKPDFHRPEFFGEIKFE